LISDVAWRLGGSEPSVEIFDRAVAHSVKPLRVGYGGRLTRVEIRVDDLDRAVLSPSPRRKRAWTGSASRSTPAHAPATKCGPPSASSPTPNRCDRRRHRSPR
jgi:hypothetical protein